MERAFNWIPFLVGRSKNSCKHLSPSPFPSLFFSRTVASEAYNFALKADSWRKRVEGEGMVAENHTNNTQSTLFFFFNLKHFIKKGTKNWVSSANNLRPFTNLTFEGLDIWPWRKLKFERAGSVSLGPEGSRGCLPPILERWDGGGQGPAAPHCPSRRKLIIVRLLLCLSLDLSLLSHKEETEAAYHKILQNH